jgi:tripartite-type tricarboxylate transporter receptor subunit TctC
LRAAAAALLLGLAGALGVFAASAETWPSRPLRLVVAFAPGGGTDIAARIVAQPLAALLGQPVVIENKPGAGGLIGADAVAKAAPDGHTLFMMNNAHAVSAVLYKALPFHAVRDFAPVGMVATMPLVFITRPGLVSDLAGLVALARANPGALNYATVGIGSTQHFAGELFRQIARIDIVHIPYKGTPNAMAAVYAGEVHLLVETLAPVIGPAHSGELAALAITTKTRLARLPEVPTMAEAGFADYDLTTWYALAFPARTAPAIVAQMNAALRKVLADPAVAKLLANAAFVPADPGTPEALGAHLEAEIQRWSNVMQRAGIERQ